jgi:hypothetical protein
MIPAECAGWLCAAFLAVWVVTVFLAYDRGWCHGVNQAIDALQGNLKKPEGKPEGKQ